MEPEQSPSSPKIFVDEDWKTRVESEKAELANSRAEKPTEPESPQPSANADDPEMPPASFEMLVTSLATEAMLALGQLPHPNGSESKPRLNQAKFVIDTLGVLQEKTAGNTTPQEASALSELLHQLRMAYVMMSTRG